MSLIQRYDLNNEKTYDELQGEAKKMMMTLNGSLDCREPAKLTYERCTERWLGPDPASNSRTTGITSRSPIMDWKALTSRHPRI